MIFTSWDYLVFLPIVVLIYWGLQKRGLQNLFLLAVSYLFYGWVHPWFCFLIAASTIVDYFCGLGFGRFPSRKRWLLMVSLVFNLGLLGAFKYFDFFSSSFTAALGRLGFSMEARTLEVFLPVGISFYTFQTLSYTIDIYRGQMVPRRNFVDFALFVGFFPQLVAGPIERARRFLPFIEKPRTWRLDGFCGAFPLLIQGYLKKMVVADNLGVVVNKIFMLEQPGAWLLFVGALAFAFQIYADFSAYTDIARGSARLLGFELVENFRSPYTAISPSDFWRRWHISFSSWIRDYLYIPLGGSRVRSGIAFLGVLVVTLGLSGLWHGAAWNFVLWGVFHAVLVFGYHQAGRGGSWIPRTPAGHFAAWFFMFACTLLGWLIFRAPSLTWLVGAFGSLGSLTPEGFVAGLYSLSLVLLYSLPLMFLGFRNRFAPRNRPVEILVSGAALIAIVLFGFDQRMDFIYFQF